MATRTETVATTTSSVAATGAHKSMSNNPSIIEFSQDLNDQEAPPPLPAGEYAAEIRGAEAKTSEQKGTRYLSVQFFISPDSYPADFVDGDPDGMTLTFNRMSLEDKPMSRYRLKKFLNAIGAELGRSFDPSTLLGLTANIEVVVGKWEGEDRSEIKRVIG